MMREWLRARRSGIAAVVSGTAIVGVVATVAIVSGGYAAQRVDLGDGAVWVTNGDQQVVGRANTQVFELNTVVDAASRNLDVSQDGAQVFVTDRGDSALDVVDAATSEVTSTVPLPPDSVVHLAGDLAVVTANGGVWTSPVSTLSDFDASADPKLALGSGSITSVDSSGRLVGFTPRTGTLSIVDAGAGVVAATSTLSGLAPDDDFGVTSVDGTWAVLDRTTRTLDLPTGRVELGDLIPDATNAVLQQPAVDGDEVLVAHRGGLVSVPLGGGTPKALVSNRAGVPAAPIVVGTCSYAAWADSIAWRQCGSRAGTSGSLDGVSGALQLTFRVNQGIVVLNDTASGATWAVQSDNRLIDNWDELIEQKRTDNIVEDNNSDSPPEYEKTQAPPVAEDDTFGARPGRATMLPVLLNDFDPNGDVLVVDSVTDPAGGTGRIDVVSNNQQVQLTLPADASGELSFSYTITDGRGGQDTATVVVAVRQESENSPPQQVRITRAGVQESGRVTTQVLTDWLDPDGDAMFLAGATVPLPDVVAFKPDGGVIFSDVEGGGDTVPVGLLVSDGRSQGSGTYVVSVKPSGTVPIVVDPFVEGTYAGEPITITPLAHVRGGSGTIRLASVPAKSGVDITPDFDGGSFRFVTSTVGSYYVDFAVTDGVQTSSGLVRIDVAAPPNGPTTPITVPHTAFVRTASDTTLDVLATDIDPTGGVLLLTGVEDVPPQSGMRVEILDQHLLRITLTRPLENGTSGFAYRVSNGLAEAVGRVTVIEVPPPARRQAPIANPDTASVRVGDVIEIPVLANDEQPDGDPLTLHPVIADRPAGTGLAFASGQVVRFLAPNRPGNYTIVYQVDAPDGQFASAEVAVSVREADPASNSSPVPRQVTARVLAGQSVRIDIPLAGIDPDGDSVQLIGQDSNPQKGAVTDSGPDWFEYTSGDYSAGTDSFTYQVIDALGGRAVGTVRIGISARLEGARNPIAVEDRVSARPGSEILVRVLANDSDPDGGDLSITAVTPTTSEGEATIDEDVISVTVPDAPGDYGFVYTIQNPRGGSSSNFLTVEARTDAPLSRPVARDTVLTLSDVLDRRTVDVDVLANVFFADGSPRDLALALVPGYDGSASVTASKKVRVEVANSSQIIPFSVTHPDDPSIVSYAFVWVPGSDDTLPQVRRSAPKITVPSESVLTIDINDYVVAVGGKQVRLTDTGTVRATHSDGSDLVVDSDTIRFRSVDKYFGPASISFEVTDGDSSSDPAGHVATIVLPITVTPRDNQPPAFTGGVIDFEPGQEKTIQLGRLTTYPYPDDFDELTYSILEPLPSGFTYSLSGRRITLKAGPDAAKGTETAITIAVRDDLNAGSPGRIVLRIVPSTRPIAVPAPDSAIAPRGQTTVVDVLRNDAATNPFPETPLRVVNVRGLETGSLPAGVSIVPNSDRSSLSVTVSGSAAPVDTNLQYQVADATGDPDRYAWGTVRISVQDRPDPVIGLRVTGYADRSLTVAFDAAAFNNSPIVGYDVSLIAAATGAVVQTVSCVATTCTVPTAGNGEANAVRVQVVAKNGIGSSDPAVTATPVWSDVVPGAPTGLLAAPLDGALAVSWDEVVVPGGTPVSSYVVNVAGVDTVASADCPAGRCAATIGGLANGSVVNFTVSARNGAYPALTAWTSTGGTGTPFGAPTPGQIGVASIDPDNGAITVS
ncbi:MAG: Ig-like domain-containing protein, partial [Leifsonia sp.]